MDTFGKVVLVGDSWNITCEPHVSARLKRVFPRMPKAAAEVLKLSRSPENSRELLWFLERYPMVVDQPDAMAADAAEHVQMEKSLARVLANVEPPPKVNLAEPAREYQELVPAILGIRNGLLLADDVGIGKTVSAICCAITQGALPAVVVMPPSLPLQWKAQFARFAPGLSVFVVKDGNVRDLYLESAERRTNQRSLLPTRGPDVILISYFRLRKWAEQLRSVAKLVVFDEGQQLRNAGTEIYRACQMMARRAEKRLALTATPIYNYGNEFFNVIDVLSPGSLGSRDEFLTEWCTKGNDGKASITDSKRFGAYLRREGLMLRRTREEVGRELPPLTKIVHEVECDTDVLSRMTGDAIALAKIILRKGESHRGEKMQAAGEFDLIMRQATGIAKAPYVAALVKLIAESGEKVLLFGWHRAVFDIWMEQLKDLNPVMFTGSESPTQKAAAGERFRNDASCMVMIMSLRAGVGVDGIQDVCHISVHGELDWSPGVHEQNLGRPYRDGQKHACLAYFCVANDGSDPVMSAVLGIKREQIEGVRNPDSALTERVQMDGGNLRELARQLLSKHEQALVELEPEVV